jgi:hypothetical protein
MKKWAFLLACCVVASSLTGCYWRPGYYLNGGGYAPAYAQPAYPQYQAPQQQCVPAPVCPPGYSPAPACSCY